MQTFQQSQVTDVTKWLLCYAMLCYAMLCHAMLCYAILLLQFRAMLCDEVAWHGMAWRGMTWHDCGVAWCGMAWHGCDMAVVEGMPRGAVSTFNGLLASGAPGWPAQLKLSLPDVLLGAGALSLARCGASRCPHAVAPEWCP